MGIRLYLEPMSRGWGLCGNLSSILLVYNSTADDPSGEPGQTASASFQGQPMDRFPRDCGGPDLGSKSVPVVGIAVGASLAGACVGGASLVAIWWARKKRKEAEVESGTTSSDDAVAAKGEA